MTATNHVLTGALIAAAVHNPWVGLPAAFASHFVLDVIPHFGTVLKLDSQNFKSLLYGDMTAALFCLVLLFGLNPAHVWIILAGGVLGASPDLMWYAKFSAANHHSKPPTPGPIRRFHSKIQWYERPPGAIVEFIWCFVMLALLKVVLAR